MIEYHISLHKIICCDKGVNKKKMKDLINSVFTNDIFVPAKTIIIAEGGFTDNLYLIKRGSVRGWYKNLSKEVTNSLLFENNIFTSVESFMFNEPSIFNVETIEDCEFSICSKVDFDKYLNSHENIKDKFYQTFIKRILIYNKRIIDLLKIKPEERYKDLVLENPEIVNRVPLNIIASYLGITSVSLSRIRSRQEEEN